MEGMAEGNHYMCVAPRQQYALNLTHYLIWSTNVFENRIALNPLENVRWERQMMSVCNDVNARSAAYIHVYVAIHHTIGTTDI